MLVFVGTKKDVQAKIHGGKETRARTETNKKGNNGASQNGVDKSCTHGLRHKAQRLAISDAVCIGWVYACINLGKPGGKLV